MSTALETKIRDGLQDNTENNKWLKKSNVRMMKIRSGQAFLYRKGGLRSTVIDVRMKEKVRGDLLRRALEKTMERYPYLKSKLVEKDGNFYIAENLLPLGFEKTDQYRALGSIEINYQLIDVTFTGHSIRVAFHHALCDGRGIKPFIETLVYYYCTYKYNKKFASTGIRLVGDPFLAGETTEPFGDREYGTGNTPMPEIERDGYILPEHDSAMEYSRYEIKIKREKFMQIAKENNATPAILIALLISKAIKNIHSDANKPIVCSMASDMRNELGCENTHKNCVNSLYLPYTEAVESLPLAEQAAIYRRIIKEQKQPDVVRRSANSQIGISAKLDQMQTLSQKKEFMSFFNDICINTFVLSYLGQMQLGECEKYVDSMHLYSTGTKGLIVNMISAGDNISIDWLQSFNSDLLMEEFIKTLEALGMDFCATGRIVFATTPDKTQVTAGMQSEKYCF